MISARLYAQESESLDLGNLSRTQWEQIVVSANELKDPDRRIVFISNAFLDTPYREKSLIGGPDQKEILVMDLAGVDCFTLLDYVESFRQAGHFSNALNVLQQVRYRDGLVSYQNRNHFFSDWLHSNREKIVDVTADIGQGKELSVNKKLNLRQDGTLWVAGIPVTQRRITYIPSAEIDLRLASALRNGDYLGVFSDLPGLDVTHTGIVIKTERELWLRHASSQDRLRRVVDSDLLEYLQGKPGILVYRGR